MRGVTSGQMARQWPSLMGKGKNSAQLGQPLLGAEGLDGGASRATTAARGFDCLADARSVKHHRRLGRFLHWRPSCVAARVIKSTRDDENDCLGNLVLLTAVGLLETTLDFDDPFGLGILSLR